jgi:ABC-type molybdate transport system substrate-binding protein
MPLRVPPDVTVFCDPALAPALRSLDRPSRRRIGTPVAVLAAPATLMLAQITRHTRNDVLFTLATAMDDAVKQQLVQPQTRVDGWNNPLVLAIAAGGRAPADPAALPTWLSTRQVAVTDDTVVSGLDGRAVLVANQLNPGRVIGTANTGDAAFLVTTGAADAALVYLSDVRGNPKLALLAPLRADPALTRLAGAVNAKAVSPNAQHFLDFMRSPAAGRRLRAAGLDLPV